MGGNVGFLLEEDGVFFFLAGLKSLFSFIKPHRNGPLVYLRGILGSQYPVKT